MRISPGEFWLANILYTDQNAAKIRPVLVLWLDAADAVVAVVTSSPPRTATDILLNDWQASGLRVASTVRLSRLDCLEQTLLLRRLGTLSPGDANRVRMVWSQNVKPQF